MLTRILRCGFNAVLIATMLLPLAQPTILATNSAAPSAPAETGAYTEDFASYTTKHYTDNTIWDIWAHSLRLARLDGPSQIYPAIARDNSGNSIIAWADYRNGASTADIYAQKLDPSGNRLWPSDVRVNSDNSTTVTPYALYAGPSIAIDGNGNAVIVWQDYRSGQYYDIYAQKLNSNGTRLWATDVRVNSDIGATWQEDPAVAMDGNGNAVIVWADSRDGNDDHIYAQKLSGNGSKLWENDVRVGSASALGSQAIPAIALDGSGRSVIVWGDYRSGNSDVYAQKLDANGNRLWTNDAQVNSDTGTAASSDATVAIDGNGVAVVTWDDYRNSNWHVYAQRLDASGSRLWAGDIHVDSGNDPGAQYVPTVAIDANSNAVIVWQNGNCEPERSSDGYCDIAAQKLDTSGRKLWASDARVNADNNATWQSDPTVAIDRSGNNIVAVWHDKRNGSDGDIYAQKLDTNGTRLWAVDVRVTSDNGSASQFYPAVAVDGSDNTLAVWADERNGNIDIYARKIDSGGNRLWMADVRVNAVLGKVARWSAAVLAVSESGNSVIVWPDERNGNSDIYIQKLDVDGNRLWVTDVRVNSDSGTARQWGPSVTVDGSSNVTIVWQDDRDGNYSGDTYAQKLDTNGNKLWTGDLRVDPTKRNTVIAWLDWRNGNGDIYAQRLDANGNPVWATDLRVNSDSGTAYQTDPVVAVDGSGNATIVWEDHRNNSNEDIYAQKLNVNGSKLWATDVRINSDNGTAKQHNSAVVMDGNGNAITLWRDERNGNSDIYAQKINSVGGKGWLADLQVVYPDQFYFPSALAQSRTIDTVTGGIRQATLTANTQLNGGSVEFALSNNGGVNWVTATLGTATVFTTAGSDLRWRSALTGDPVWRNRSPIVTSLRIDYSTAVPYADDYEADDDCTQAKPIATGGAAQAHTFHQQADADWTWFDVITNTTYVVQATHTGTNADLELALYDTCQHVVQNGDPSLGNDVRLVLDGLPAGRYFLKATNADPNVFGADTGYTLSVRLDRPNGLAIIVAGRLKMNDVLQPNINTAANRAYLTFLQRGYSKQNLYYLNTQTAQDVDGNGLHDDVDGTPSVTNVREAIQTWARQRGVALGVPLYVYLVDHGDVDRFHADLGQQVTAELLNLWLSNLEATTGADQITIILEACFSGSFVDQYQTQGYGVAEIAGLNRVIVSSTSSWANAFPLGDGVLFSGAFWDAMREGRSVRASFQQGQVAVQAAGFVNCTYPNLFCQQPWLDDNGNGVPNEATDGALAQARGLPATLGWEVPEVVAVTVNVPDTGGAGNIEAEVYDNGALSTVEAMVIPPGYQPVIPGDGSLPPWTVPTVTLTTAGNNLFAGQFNFTQRGFYRVVAYARDGQNNQSSPQAVIVCINCSYTYLPLIRK